MKVNFRIHYNTKWGENLHLHYKTKPNSECEIINLTPSATGYWTYNLDIKTDTLFYRYEFIDSAGNHEVEKEFRHYNYDGIINTIDTWRSPHTPANALYSLAFTQAVFRNGAHQSVKEKIEGLTIRLREIRKGDNEAFCLVSQQHGNWDTKKPYMMSQSGNFTWECHLTKPEEPEIFTFKFGLWNLKTNSFKGFEDGDNHHIEIKPDSGAIVCNIDGFRYSHFWRGTGVAVPVFSLRSSQSMGCGEFSDLIPLAEWCQTAGVKMIQLLPINDTMATNTWQDTYPYNAISVMAFHPMFINVQRVYKHYAETADAKLISEMEEANNAPQVDYEKTLSWKLKATKALFSKLGSKIVDEPQFSKYYNDNKWWVADYAVFSVLRDKYSTPDFRQWSELSKYNKTQVLSHLEKGSAYHDDVWFYIFLQYHLQMQLEEAIEYAHSRSIAFKGDLPIGINPSSVEAWTEPSKFNFGLQAGAPPDFFSASGQNWGFPTYNWDEMKRDGYAWWQKRLGRMQQFFDAFRIDHILGFFRIWSIPHPFKDGIMGHFEPALPMCSQELQRFGYHTDPEYFTLPVCDRYYLDELCGEYAQLVDDQLFAPTAYGHRRMKAQYFNPAETQKWVEQNIAKNYRDHINRSIELLMREILFIKADDTCWHPRIMLTESRIYSQLSAAEQNALRGIHDHYFYHRHNDFWKQSAIERLEGTLQHCNMLVCGEDLGMIPASVPEVMQRLQILSLEIQRMPKEMSHRYGDTWSYPYMSVCTPSTHDISSLRGWWEENRGETEFYYYNVMHRHGAFPEHMTGDIAKSIIETHLQSPSMWCIIPLQDIAAMDDNAPKLEAALERINEPANPKHYWRYRIPFNIDDAETTSEMGTIMANLNKKSGR